jgi:repressor LexA
MAEQLTERQGKILEFVVEYGRQYGYPPTLREIGDKFRISSVNGVRDHLRALERKGYVQRQGGRSRALEVLRPGRTSGAYPIVGKVAAGTPILAEENFEGFLDLAGLFGDDAKLFALKIHGDSMIKAGILDGDYVIVKSQQQVEDGEIAVVYLDGESTVKRVKRRGALIRLVPENDSMEPIEFSPEDREFRVGGKVVGVVRKS